MLLEVKRFKGLNGPNVFASFLKTNPPSFISMQFSSLNTTLNEGSKTSSGLPLPWPLHAPTGKTFPLLPRKHDAQSANLGHAGCTNSLRAASAFPISLQLIQAAYTAPYSCICLLISDRLRNDHLNLLIPGYRICILQQLHQENPRNMDQK